MSDQSHQDQDNTKSVSRRGMLKGAAGVAAVAAAAAIPGCQTSKAGGNVPEDFKVSKGNINQSVVHWCFNLDDKNKMNPKHKPMTEAQLADHARKMGVKSVELISPEHYKMLQSVGMTCAIAPNGMPGAPFIKGLNNPKYHEQVVKNTKAAIDACAEYKVPSVIAFNGYKWRDAEDDKSGEISLDEGAADCVEGLKKLAGHAEKNGVTVCLEMLNTRDGSHPMKGHPGYQGDDLDYCADIVNKVGSKNVKLLFDVYHVQIMDGDVIRRINQFKDIIGHYHTAGNPGRRELDDNNEINYPAVMAAIAETDYKGFVAQEFIPTWDDKIAALRHAVHLCDV